MSAGNDIWRGYIDQLSPGSMASTETRSSDSERIDKCPFCESSLYASTETVPNTPESSMSIDLGCCYPEREHYPTERLIEDN